MVERKPKAGARPTGTGNSWSAQLSSILAVAEILVGPPLGSNIRFAKFLRRLTPLIEDLPDLTEREFLDAIRRLSLRQSRDRTHSQETDEELRGLSLDEVERRLFDPSTTKQELLNLARARFDSSTGTLIRLSKDALAQRIEALLMNERTHQTLARAASGERGGGPSESQEKGGFRPSSVAKREPEGKDFGADDARDYRELGSLKDLPRRTEYPRAR
jgi:hypothetical protein